MALIKLNPEEIISYGQEIKGMAGQVQTMLDDISKLVTQINAGWSGLGNQAFAAQYTELKSKLENLPKIVEGVGGQVETGGRTMQELESKLGQRA